MLKDIVENCLNSDTLELNSDELIYLYNQGVKAFQIGNYTKALSMFLLLVKHDPTNLNYIKALAGSMQATKDYLSAAIMYKYAFSLSSGVDYDTLFYAGVCFYEAKHYQMAKSNLSEYLVNQCSNKNNEEKINKSKMYLNMIK